MTLKAEANSGSGAMFVEAARRFFNLEEKPVLSSPDETDEGAVLNSSTALVPIGDSSGSQVESATKRPGENPSKKAQADL
ncbi:MAG: hypothetical protein C4293_03820 [Nitrospiraceae bacterium]